MDEAQRREKERAERERERSSRERILQEDYKRNSSVWCLLCFACTIRNPSWERQWPVRGEREDARPDSDIFVSEIQKNDISAVPSVSDFILSEREEG